MTETSVLTKGIGVVDGDDADAIEDKGGNSETLKEVMQSKGLAGVFDHNFLNEDVSRISVTGREIEEKAKQIARQAANALRQSTTQERLIAPRWAGINEIVTMEVSRASTQPSSAGLLSSLRNRQKIVSSCGLSASPNESTIQFADLLKRIDAFVRLNEPSTDEILLYFESEPDCDAPIFKQLLKSVAILVKGRWTAK